MDEETYNCLEKIMDYLYEDERKAWEEAGHPDAHIYKCIRQVNTWLNDNEPLPTGE